jgi:hypothetical protein
MVVGTEEMAGAWNGGSSGDPMLLEAFSKPILVLHENLQTIAQAPIHVRKHPPKPRLQYG